MSDEEFEEQQQLDLQGQADPKIILIRIGGQNVTTQVDQSELEPVDKTDRKKAKEKLIPVRESATEQVSEEQPVIEDSADLRKKNEESGQRDKLQQKSKNVQIFAKNVQPSVKKEKSRPKTVQSSLKTIYTGPLKDSSDQHIVNYEVRPDLQIGIIGTVELAIEVDLRAYRNQLYGLLQVYKKLYKHPETEHLVLLIMALDNHQHLNNAQLMKMHSEFGDMVIPEDILDVQRKNVASQENAR